MFAVMPDADTPDADAPDAGGALRLIRRNRFWMSEVVIFASFFSPFLIPALSPSLLDSHHSLIIHRFLHLSTFKEEIINFF